MIKRIITNGVPYLSTIEFHFRFWLWRENFFVSDVREEERSERRSNCSPLWRTSLIFLVRTRWTAPKSSLSLSYGLALESVRSLDFFLNLLNSGWNERNAYGLWVVSIYICKLKIFFSYLWSKCSIKCAGNWF